MKTTFSTASPVWVAALAVLAAGCDYGGDFLFTQSEIDDIWILQPDNGDELFTPAVVTNLDELRANTVYAEVGTPLTTAYGGVTFGFTGTGRDVCIWIDPEVAYWSQSVAPRPSETADKWTYPDNVFDDGDIDLFAGLSVYYTGSPGVEIGDFQVEYEDSLGNPIPISLAECPNTVGLSEDPASSGRGAPEFCQIDTTELGIDYTVVLRTWSTPLDDDRLGFGLILADGKCDVASTGGGGPGGGTAGIRQIGGGSADQPEMDECVIQGEAITPSGSDKGPFFGLDALNGSGRIWERSVEFEAAFCDPDVRMRKFCDDEADAMTESGVRCDWHGPPTADNRCYCGDPNDTPTGGAI